MNGTTRLAALFGTWGRPVDRPALWALVIGLLLALVAILPTSVHAGLGILGGLTAQRESRRRLVLFLAFAAAFLSLGYVAFYLRAGPRIIDATSYFLEGRVLSHGHFSWSIPSPSASFRGRFLLLHDRDQLAVIFPPGYPLLLAAGFLVGAPLVVGPLLAGALVVATYALARELAHERGELERNGVAMLAATLSVACAALRYHTADTMAHGASALGITIAVASGCFARRTGRGIAWLVAGLAAGWVSCTRPVSSIAILAVLAVLAARSQPGDARLRWGAIVLGVVPGVLFLVLASHAQTGLWLTPAQSAYYVVSDGPPGCFRYGFGAGVGCLGEHKDFVLARLPHGFGALEALLTTLRRLRIHLLDVVNLEPLALLVLVPLFRPSAGSSRRAAALPAVALMVVVGQMVAYAPFYFDGDYPGGGARFFADVLPIEHALVALGAASIFRRVRFYRRALALVSLALVGFAVHGAFEHDALARRDGGRPMFDPDQARAAKVTKGVMFLDTDHGFDLAYDPYADPKKGVLAARLRGDDHDRLLIERLDHPPAHVYKDDALHVSVTSWGAKPGSSKDLWHFVAEADWPPLSQRGGWGERVWASNSCATDGRVFTLHVSGDATASAVATIELPAPRAGKWTVLPRVVQRGGAGRGSLRLIPKGRASLPADEHLVWDWRDDDGAAQPGHDVCAELSPRDAAVATVELTAAGAEWELTATGGDVSLDQTTLRAR